MPWLGLCDSLSVFHRGAQVGGLTLWVKRTGDGTQYDDIAAVPSETVAQFKRRWVAQEKLEVTPSLVSLHLVHRGPARLTKDPAERKAAEEAATVLDPSDTLAQAGVTDGSWLVAEFASQASEPSTATLLRLLESAHVRPVEHNVMRRIVSRFSARLGQVLLAGDPQFAADLYADARDLPSVATRADFELSGYLLDGPLYEGSNLTIAFKGLSMHVVKALDAPEHSRAVELQAAMQSSGVQPCPHLVSFELTSAHGRRFMIMPHMATTLAHMPRLEEEGASMLVQHVSTAIRYLHELGFSHADVKPDNVGLQVPETFVLIDLGSVARFHARTSVTPAYVPCDLAGLSGRYVSEPSLDWWMLGMTLAEKACVPDSCMDISSTGRSASRSALVAHLEHHLPARVWEQYVAAAGGEVPELMRP